MSIDKKSSEYFKLEKERDLFARQRRYKELKETYASPIRLENKNTGKFWEHKFSSEEEINLQNPMEAHRNKTAAEWFLKLITTNSLTLNIGCGDGNFEKILSTYKIRFKHHCADITNHLLKTLNKNYPMFTFFQMDIASKKLSLKKGSYQIVTMFEVLEHISPENTFSVLSNVHSLLKKRGMFMLSVPMNEGLEKMFPYNPNEHLRCYTRELVTAELRIAGFQIVREQLFYAFSRNYEIKNFLAQTFLKGKWRPNNILLLCRKK